MPPGPPAAPAAQTGRGRPDLSPESRDMSAAQQRAPGGLPSETPRAAPLTMVPRPARPPPLQPPGPAPLPAHKPLPLPRLPPGARLAAEVTPGPRQLEDRPELPKQMPARTASRRAARLGGHPRARRSAPRAGRERQQVGKRLPEHNRLHGFLKEPPQALLRQPCPGKALARPQPRDAAGRPKMNFPAYTRGVAGTVSAGRETGTRQVNGNGSGRWGWGELQQRDEGKRAGEGVQGRICACALSAPSCGAATAHAQSWGMKPEVMAAGTGCP